MERLVLASARYFTRIPLVPNGQPRPSDTPNHWTVPKARAVLGKSGPILDFPLLDILRMIYDAAGVSKIYVIAHSMGNQIVVDALAHAQDAGIRISLSELVLAAPDVDSDVFRSMVDRLRVAAKGLTLYVSSADKAMLASRIKAGGVPRAGDVPASGPLIAQGIDTIDVTAIGDDLFGLNHDEYSSNRSLIDDIGRILLTSTRPPNVRSPQLRRVPEGSEHPLFWRYTQ